MKRLFHRLANRHVTSKMVIATAALIFSLSYAFHVFIEVRTLNLRATQTVILCADNYNDQGYNICKEHSLKYGIFNIDDDF